MIDFKENLHLNMAAEETSYNFYTCPQRAYFNLTIWYLDNKELKMKFFDCISKDLNKTTWWVQNALNSIFPLNEFKALQIKKLYTIVMDKAYFKLMKCNIIYIL